MNRSPHANARAILVLSVLASACSQLQAAEYIERPIEPLHQQPETTNSISHPNWLHWWIFDISPRISAQSLYDDNITSQSDAAKLDDFIFAVTPGFTAVAGDRFAERA